MKNVSSIILTSQFNLKGGANCAWTKYYEQILKEEKGKIEESYINSHVLTLWDFRREWP